MFKAGTTNEADRYKWTEEALKKIPEGLTLLDAGAGESQFKKYCRHLKYIAQDFGQYTGAGEVGVHTGTWDNSKLDIVSDIVNIPLPDHSVDAVMCTEVLEHVPDPLAAIREFSRLVKPGGYLILTAPFCSLTHFAPYHFSTGFSRFFYEKHLPDNDFSIEDIKLSGNFFEYMAQETRRIKMVANRYTGQRMGLIGKIIIHLQILLLQHYSKKDRGSNELLCYDIHVFARKMP
jgi:ubiquinone/menaquinone biosynthesis C-methylase UbiE